MTTAKELMDFARTRIEANRAQAGTLGAVYKFVLAGDDGGTFLINMKDNPGITEVDGDAQCTIRMGAKDFVKMVESGTNPRQLVFFGKMKIDGDMGLAMKLSKFAEMFKNRN